MSETNGFDTNAFLGALDVATDMAFDCAVACERCERDGCCGCGSCPESESCKPYKAFKTLYTARRMLVEFFAGTEKPQPIDNGIELGIKSAYESLREPIMRNIADEALCRRENGVHCHECRNYDICGVRITGSILMQASLQIREIKEKIYGKETKNEH